MWYEGGRNIRTVRPDKRDQQSLPQKICNANPFSNSHQGAPFSSDEAPSPYTSSRLLPGSINSQQTARSARQSHDAFIKVDVAQRSHWDNPVREIGDKLHIGRRALFMNLLRLNHTLTILLVNRRLSAAQLRNGIDASDDVESQAIQPEPPGLLLISRGVLRRPDAGSIQLWEKSVSSSSQHK